MKLKKFLALSVSAVLAMTALTACGSKDDSSEAASESTSSKKTAKVIEIDLTDEQWKCHHRRQDITRLNDEEMSVFRRRKIGFVFQAYHLIPVLTVEENIRMPILLDHRKPDRDYIDHIIEMLGLKDRKKYLPNQLSGGQQQRAAIARALANRPALVLADEPTGALDSKNGNEVLTLLQDSVKKLNQTLVLITHNIDLAREADRIIKIADGKIVE